MGTQPDVLVVGGGIIGLTSAYFLAKAGAAVEVIDRGEMGREASWAGAGIVPPGNPDRAAHPFDLLRAYSTSRFPAFSAELRDRTGIDNGFVRCGGVEFFPSHDPELDEIVRGWDCEGIAFDHVTPRKLRAVEPGVAFPPDHVALLLPDCGQVRNPWHLRALVAACERAGVRLRPHTPFPGWENPGAGKVLVTAGAWADDLLAPLGCRPGVRPVRGQIVLFRPDAPLFTRVLMVGKRYLVPRPDGRVLVGSTEEPAAGFEKANTPDGIAGLTAFACGLVPELRNAAVEKTWAGLRPGSPDGMPFLGVVPGHPGVFAAVGHFRAGVQLSVGTAAVMAKLVLGEPPPFPVEAFRLDREPDLAAKPAFRS